MDSRVATVIALMRESLATHRSISILANGVNLSASRLRQLFRMETGRTPVQYRRELCLDHAETLLKMTFLSVKEVAFISGIKDVSTFARYFKARHGITPSEFRRQSQSAQRIAADYFKKSE